MIERPTRRGLISGLVVLMAAPAVVRAASLMPVRAHPLLAPDVVPVDRLDVLFATGSLQIPAGTMWFDVNDNKMKVYDGSVWADSEPRYHEICTAHGADGPTILKPRDMFGHVHVGFEPPRPEPPVVDDYVMDPELAAALNKEFPHHGQ